MESSLSSIQTLVNELKDNMFSTTIDFYSYVSPSAYDTAWLAMILDPKQRDRPMFSDCLNWILNNQEKEGFWGTSGVDGVPTIDRLTATLASVVALKTWDVGAENIEKGLAYIHENWEEILLEHRSSLPRWFVIVFPAMVELAQAIGLELVFPQKVKEVVLDVFLKRKRILEKEELVDKDQLYPPLLSYLEALPSTYCIGEEDILMHLSEDGSLFQSPSATACAFMATGNKKCMEYLVSIVQRCPLGGAVPPMYPLDEEIIKLCMVNQIEKLGLAEYFSQEIEQLLSQVYRCYKKQELQATTSELVPAQLYKDSLAFWLFRTHGYKVTPLMFCWFLHHEDLLDHLEKSFEHYASVMYNVYRATELMFSGEYELQEARSFSRNLLEKTMILRHNFDDNLVQFPNRRRVIEHELRLPWMARLDHLDHRMWIEENKFNSVWIGKASFYRLSCLHNPKLMQLAVENYEFRQSIYRNELEELKRWSEEWGLSNMGFGREKTTYCYFAVAATNCQPQNSLIRMIVAKSAILITVADDFYDIEGSPNDLLLLTQAVQRWDGRGLSGHGKIIFDALDNLVSDIVANYLHQQGINITESLRAIWVETFDSWMRETMWSNTGYKPTKEEYIETGMISIATHTVVLLASCFINTIPTTSLPFHNYLNTMIMEEYETLTKLLMASARLLNDIQSYQKELEVGKVNLVMLHLNENPHEDIEDSIAYVKEILEEKKIKLLEQVLMDGFNDLPKSCKHLHLSCLKVFQMFFNSTNLFDSETDLLQDIMKAIYVPIQQHRSNSSKPLKPLPSLPLSKLKNEKPKSSANFDIHHFKKNHGAPSFIGQRFQVKISKQVHGKVFIPPKFNLCFV